MRYHLRLPRYAASTVEVGLDQGRAVLDHSDVVVPNRWRLPPHTVAVVGRRAVWLSLDLLGLHWEQDVGGHLFLVVTGADATQATIVETGPANPNGTGALVPFHYPEDRFAEHKISDFQPRIVPPPHGLSAEFFAGLICAISREYDGDQRYRAVEIPFLRVGRDSNSYAVGVLLCAGVDPRWVYGLREKLGHRELTGYPGAEDPVHRANFGQYLGVPAGLGDGTVQVAIHKADGSIMVVVVGGEPNGRARLPDGTELELDPFGRIAFAPDDAHRHGMRSVRVDPPEHIRARRSFPPDPAKAGAQLTILLNERPTALAPGDRYRGTIVDRHSALGLVTLRTEAGDCVLPLGEFGVEMRDPERADRLLRIGNEVTVGLHGDRRPKLVLHGNAAVADKLRWRRFHAPPRASVAVTIALGGLLLAAGAMWWRARG